MYLHPTERHWACDIEADGLLDEATRIWCVWLVNCVTKEKVLCLSKEEFKSFQETHSNAIFVGHNFISYDVMMLNRHWNARIPITRVLDTFVLSQLYNPNYKGGHSLDIWGQRLRFPKTEFNDFSKLSDEMIAYCLNDTQLTALLYNRLTERMRQVGFTEEGCRIEHLAWNIIQNKQRQNGFPFDYKKAHELYVSLRKREEELKNECYKLWPPEFRCVAERKQARKKNGDYTAKYVEDCGKFPKLEERPDGTYGCYDWVEFNLGSPDQRVGKLLELGWQPTSFTKKTAKGGGGNPKVDEDSLLAFAEESDNPEVKALAKWIVVNGRANNVRNWMNEYREHTGCLHGRLFIAGTLRYRHSGPNSANIPGVRVGKDGHPLLGEDGAWTYESRDLYHSGGEDWTLVGIDAKGIQLRILAHYIDVPAFTAAILSDDPHTANMKTFGLASRSLTKTITYATLMGAGDDRISREAKVSLEEAKAGKAQFFRAVPTLPALISRLKDDVEQTGRIRLCDGTPLLVPQSYRVIPYLLQGDESRLMRQALIFVDAEIRKRKLTESILKVADIHDEWQWRVRNEHVEEFLSFALPCFNRAGEHFDYRIPVDGDAKVGKTWAETH